MIESNGEWTWSYTATTNRDIYFRIVGRWSDGWYEKGIAPSTDGTAVTTSYQNSDWNNDNAWKLTVTAGKTYTLYKNSSNQIKYSATDVVVADTYVVAGPQAIFGSNWDGTASANTMTEGANGIYTFTLNGVNLTASTNYEYKIVKNGSQWIPDGNGNNLTFNVPLNGSYNVTFTFDSSTNTCEVTYDLQNATGGETYTVAGSNTTILGSEWGQGDTNNDMSLVNGVYQLTYNDVVISDNNPSCEFRVVVNHSWVTAYPVGNANVTGFNGSGTYDVVFTYDPSDNSVSGVATKHTTVFYVVGQDTSIFPNAWEMGTGTAMTDNQDGTYTWTAEVHLTPGVDYEYKVRGDDNSWHPSGDNQTFNVNVPGTYTLTITYDSNSGTVTATTELVTADPISNVYIIGNANTQQWAANAGIQMEYDSQTGYYTMKNVVLTSMSYFALATHLGSNSEDWATLNANRLSSNGESHWLVNDYWLSEDEDHWMPTMSYTDDNHNWYVEQSGSYDFYFNPTNPQLLIKKSFDKMYISYGVGWNFDDNSVEMTTVDGNVYQATITLNQGDFFLFSTNKSVDTAWGATEAGYVITDLMVGYAQRLKEDTINNYNFTGTTGKYIVVVNKAKKTVTLRRAADATVTKIFLEKTNVTLDPAGGTYNNQPVDGKKGGIYAWNKLNLQTVGHTYGYAPNNGPTNYTYAGEVGNGYGGDNYLKDLPDTTTLDQKQWYAWSVANSICEFYFIRTNKEDKKSQKIIRRSGEIWLTWIDEDATSNRQDNAMHCDSLLEVTRDYYDVNASGVSDCATMLEDHYYVYYTNTTGWDSVYCYAWYEVGTDVREFTKEYPGNKCTFVGYDEDGFEIWCYDFGLMEDFHDKYGDITPTNVIFDNGKGGADEGAEGDKVREQTGDLIFDNGACYDYLGMIYLGNSLNGIINTGIVNGPKYTVEDDLIGVYYDENAVTRIYETDMNGNPIIDDLTGKPRHIDVVGALYAKDVENYSAKSMQPEGTTDYVYGPCAHPASNTYPGGSQIQLQRTYYDQSNWVKIVISPNFDNENIENTDVTYNRTKFDGVKFHDTQDEQQYPDGYLRQYVDKIIPGGSMSGNLVSNVNPQMHITNIANPVALTKPYEKNVYVTGHFNDTVVFSYVHQDWNPGYYNGVHKTVPVYETDENNNTIVDHMWVSPELYKMFYVAPKPQEIAFITWAVFDHTDKKVGDPDYESEPDTPGAFYAPMNWDRTGQLTNGTDPEVPYGETYGPYSNGFMQYGAFKVNWSLFEGMEADDSDNPTNRSQDPWYRIFKPGQAYKILALIRYAHDDKGNIEYMPGVYKGVETDDEYDGYNDGYNEEDLGNHVANAPRRYDNMDHVLYPGLADSKFIVFPLLGSNSESEDGSGIGNVTVVKEVVAPRTIVGTNYYNLMGVESDKPFDGLNIVVTTYSDGSRTSKKVMR
ncbi:MAG: starch-binding protein [Muribaculaceae bacterium]|nr:starch-binding protein [Muribaculaceae bacterium]